MNHTAKQRSSRRTVLGFLSAGTVAAAGILGGRDTASAGARPVPGDLRPGGSYDRYLTDLADRGEFSGTVLFAYRGKPVLSRSHGMAIKEDAVPNGKDTIFALASASKPFTGVAVLQLVQRGKLQLWEKLGAYVPGFPEEIAEQVTIHHLLTHTSGMGDLNTTPEYSAAARIWDTVEEVVEGTLEFVRRAPLHFTPGTGTRYSNNGYHVLGSVIANVAGQSFYDYTREHVFGPAGMTSTDFYTRPQWLSDRRIAQPYWLSENKERINALREPDRLGDFPNATNLFIGGSGGNGFSTAPDILRFAHALRSGRLLNPAFTELYWSAKSPNPPRGQNPGGGGDRPTAVGARAAAVRGSFHAYGAPVALYDNRWLFGHGGGAAGESTNWTIYRDMDWTTVVLANHDGFDLQSLIDHERGLILATDH
ncbi:serine hydrolase domain-containing protein [Actinophytocola sediminis]